MNLSIVVQEQTNFEKVRIKRQLEELKYQLQLQRSRRNLKSNDSDKVFNLEYEKKQLQIRLSTANRHLEQKNDEIEILKKSQQRLKNKIIDLQNEQDKRKQIFYGERYKKQQIIASMAEEKRKLIQTCENLSKQNKRINQLNINSETKVRQLTTTINNLSQDKNSYLNKIIILERQLQKLKNLQTTSYKQKQRHLSQKANLNKTLTNSQQQNKKLREQMQIFKKQNQTLKHKQYQLRTEIQKLKTRIGISEKYLGKTKESIQTLENKIIQKQKSIQQLNNKITIIGTQLTKTKESITIFQNKIRDKQKTIQKLKIKIKTLEIQLSKTKESILMLENKVIQKQKTIQDLLTKIFYNTQTLVSTTKKQQSIKRNQNKSTHLQHEIKKQEEIQVPKQQIKQEKVQIHTQAAKQVKQVQIQGLNSSSKSTKFSNVDQKQIKMQSKNQNLKNKKIQKPWKLITNIPSSERICRQIHKYLQQNEINIDSKIYDLKDKIQFQKQERIILLNFSSYEANKTIVDSKFLHNTSEQIKKTLSIVEIKQKLSEKQKYKQKDYVLPSQTQKYVMQLIQSNKQQNQSMKQIHFSNEFKELVTKIKQGL